MTRINISGNAQYSDALACKWAAGVRQGQRLDISVYVGKQGRAHKLDLTLYFTQRVWLQKKREKKLGNSRKRGVRGGGNHAERDKSEGLAWKCRRWEVYQLVGLAVCEYLCTMCVCVCLLSTLVTSGVIFLASRRDSEIIRNVNTHWSLYSYEFSVSFSLSLSFAVAFINTQTHTHTHSLGIILSPLVQACVMNDTCKAWHDLAMWQWNDICGNNALSPALCLCLWRKMHFNFLLCPFLHWVNNEFG